MRTRYTINEQGELVSRDGVILGRVVGVTIDHSKGANLGTMGKEGNVGTTEATDVSQPPAPSENPTAEVWAHYEKVFDFKRGKLNETRKRIIRTALKAEMEAADSVLTKTEKERLAIIRCCRAIDGLRISPYHNGENEQRTTYLDIRYALKGNSRNGESTEERIEKMCAMAGQVASMGVPSATNVTISRLLDEVRYTLETGGERDRARRAKARLEEMGYRVQRHEGAPWASLERSDG